MVCSHVTRMCGRDGFYIYTCFVWHKGARRLADPMKGGSYLFSIHSTCIKHQLYTRCQDDFIYSYWANWLLRMHSVTGKLVIVLKTICCACVSPDMCFSCPKDKFIPNKMIYVKNSVP